MRLILHPLSLIYGSIVAIRNLLFDYNIFKSKQHNIPIICIGNLSVGGSGKTPHTNYIANLLSQDYKVAILSRGYGRKSSNFKYVETNSNPSTVGDEPLQLKINNPNCIVAVNKNRNDGVEKIILNHPEIDVILLDDGFQHRWINAGLNIIITPFQNLYTNDYLLPFGKLRERKAEAKRADIVVVSKVPKDTTTNKRKEIVETLNLENNQEGYFSSISYQKYKCISNNTKLENEEDFSVTLVSGVANITPLEEYLKEKNIKLQSVRYKDHHNYTLKDIENILAIHNKDKSLKKLILTTEKDAAKLKAFSSYFKNVNVYYIPIDIMIDSKEKFEKQILEYVAKN